MQLNRKLRMRAPAADDRESWLAVRFQDIEAAPGRTMMTSAIDCEPAFTRESFECRFAVGPALTARLQSAR